MNDSPCMAITSRSGKMSPNPCLGAPYNMHEVKLEKEVNDEVPTKSEKL